MTSRQANGPFDIELTPQVLSSTAEASGLGRMALEKRFHGELEAESRGEMLAFRGALGSAGYVAMETVSGQLHGREGSFVLQHSSTMTRGVPVQAVFVVPDSGTGQLTGLSGQMTITVQEGRHSYRLDYSLPELA